VTRWQAFDRKILDRKILSRSRMGLIVFESRHRNCGREKVGLVTSPAFPIRP